MYNNNNDYYFKDTDDLFRFIQNHTSRKGKRKPKRQINKSDVKWAWF